jgi:hypothetical protein
MSNAPSVHVVSNVPGLKELFESIFNGTPVEESAPEACDCCKGACPAHEEPKSYVNVGENGVRNVEADLSIEISDSGNDTDHASLTINAQGTSAFELIRLIQGMALSVSEEVKYMADSLTVNMSSTFNSEVV